MGPPTLSPQQIARVRKGLRELFERCDRNQSALARQLHMSQSAVRDLLQEYNRPSFPTAEKIARLLDVSVSVMLGLPEPVTPTEQSHPVLFATIDFVGTHASAEAKDRVLAAAAFLPDFSQATWLAMLLDHAHGVAAVPSSRRAPERTTEIPLVPAKKPG